MVSSTSGRILWAIRELMESMNNADTFYSSRGESFRTQTPPPAPLRKEFISDSTFSGFSITTAWPSLFITTLTELGIVSAMLSWNSIGIALSFFPIITKLGIERLFNRWKSLILLLGCKYCSHVSLLTDAAASTNSENSFRGNGFIKTLFKSCFRRILFCETNDRIIDIKGKPFENKVPGPGFIRIRDFILSGKFIANCIAIAPPIDIPARTQASIFFKMAN